MDPSNWRDQLLPETRQLILSNIMDQLKLGDLPGDYDEFLEFQKIAQSVEQKSYAGATSQSDYFEKIASKMLLLKKAREREWKNKQEEVYQKIKTMINYLLELNEMYEKIATKLQQSDRLEKLKVFKMMLERIISFLQISKSNILPRHAEKLGSYEKQIINFINVNRPRKAMSSVQPGQLPPPHVHSMSQPQSPVTRVQSHENQVKSQLRITNIQGYRVTRSYNLLFVRETIFW